ncbi:MAG: RNA-binding S4 domain-containing protein [Erysipelotrichaceae bacterium]|nr:RNA-binding S4 domain-containing protein [Erysipelotrichaceae bacterium]MBQ1810652.1 RNA-binding S4 domain-containing protein [Erysipelotrichaceae bacterium]
MRIDKYLKVARVLKRRSTGKNLADNERLYVNGRRAKAAAQVKPGDEVTVVFGQRKLVIRVLSTPDHVRKEEAASLFEVLDESIYEEKDEYEEEKTQQDRS